MNRREFFGITVGAGATCALTPELLSAFQPTQGQLIQRAIPSSGEMLPVIGFAPRPGDPAGLREILTTLVDRGGRVVDPLHAPAAVEQAARTAAVELGIQNRLFWTTSLSVVVPVLPGYAGPRPTPTPAAVRAAMEEKFATFKVPMIDMVMVWTTVDMPTHLAAVREMKKEGRIRYIGVHHLAFPPDAPTPPFGNLESIMRDEDIDFIGTDYSLGDRRAEETILPLAQERKIGVMAYFPFDRARGLQRVRNTPLPEWAAEFDAKTWAQFFLKYVISHPAVTVARTGTTRAEHMLDNIGGGIGRLPDEATRKRMAQLIDSLPPAPPPAPPQPQQQAAQAPPVVLSAAILDRYVGEYTYAAAGQLVTFRRDGDRLLMKISGNVPEVPLAARSETRFQGPGGLIFEFQLDAQGKVIGAIVEQGSNRIPLERK